MPRPIGPRDPRGPGWHMTIHQRVGLLPVKIGGQTQPYSDDRLGPVDTYRIHKTMAAIVTTAR